tara:strand:+ start:144 stop:443 length:300 start_codon:yes stop_codon:yes gene_type:complete
MSENDNIREVEVRLNAVLKVRIEGAESLDGFDVYQDLRFKFAEDFERWLTVTQGTFIMCEGGYNAVGIDTIPVEVGVTMTPNKSEVYEAFVYRHAGGES